MSSLHCDQKSLIYADFFRYKSRFLTIFLLLSYSYIHTKLTGVYVEATLDQFIDFSVRLPYAQRLLVPALARFFSSLLPLETFHIFMLLEWLFVTLLYFALVHLLSFEFERREAKLLSWLFIILLPLVTVINYRFDVKGSAPIYFPNDTASLFFMALGFLFCLRQSWGYFIAWIFLATFNRESSVLLLLLIPALHWQHLREVIRPFFLAFLAFIAARLIIWFFVHHLPGHMIEWCYFKNFTTHFEVNLLRLIDGQQIFFFLFCMAGLPFFWFVFYDYIPLRYRPIRYVALFYFLGLLVVGNFVEARIFSEILILLYLPVCVALRRWLTRQPSELYQQESGILFYIDRYAVISLLAAVVLLRSPLNKVVIWLSHHLF
ncbi:MAG: hypothetical protein Q8M03_06045 [Legionella sp.]|nr:hypothetical protein [Legionella sp.]